MVTWSFFVLDEAQGRGKQIMMFDEDLCFWSWEEDIITCKFYLDHLNDWSKNLNISKLVEKLKMFGYIKNAYDVRNQAFKLCGYKNWCWR